jgi:hypothetical protein
MTVCILFKDDTTEQDELRLNLLQSLDTQQQWTTSVIAIDTLYKISGNNTYKIVNYITKFLKLNHRGYTFHLNLEEPCLIVIGQSLNKKSPTTTTTTTTTANPPITPPRSLTPAPRVPPLNNNKKKSKKRVIQGRRKPKRRSLTPIFDQLLEPERNSKRKSLTPIFDQLEPENNIKKMKFEQEDNNNPWEDCIFDNSDIRKDQLLFSQYD